jgi:hypothetical protein
MVINKLLQSNNKRDKIKAYQTTIHVLKTKQKDINTTIKNNKQFK